MRVLVCVCVCVCVCVYVCVFVYILCAVHFLCLCVDCVRVCGRCACLFVDLTIKLNLCPQYYQVSVLPKLLLATLAKILTICGKLTCVLKHAGCTAEVGTFIQTAGRWSWKLKSAKECACVCACVCVCVCVTAHRLPWCPQCFLRVACLHCPHVRE